MRHTPRPIIDITHIIPELAPLARETVRLHPRRGEAAQDASKIGGSFIWPADEPWPHCKEHNCPYIPILQLQRGDIPELRFRNGTDLFQLLWCPNNHTTIEPLYAPASQLFWRKRSDIQATVSFIPTVGEEEYNPRPCILHPERVVEYPSAIVLWYDWPDMWKKIETNVQLQQMLEAVTEVDFEDTGMLYDNWLSVAAGTKVGGHPQWIQDPTIPTCRCGNNMDYLLTISSDEFDGGTGVRWLPEEDRDVWNSGHTTIDSIRSAADLMLGDAGNLNYFVCRKCSDWPNTSLFQCC